MEYFPNHFLTQCLWRITNKRYLKLTYDMKQMVHQVPSSDYKKGFCFF